MDCVCVQMLDMLFIDGMAAVLGHEISHQLARHSAEKLSFAKILLALQFTLAFLGIDPSFIFNRFSLNFLMMKPFSRKCETEADDIGLQLMALACFDPREAINVWKRMEAVGEVDIPQFASTHPSHKNRIQFLTKEVKLDPTSYCILYSLFLTSISYLQHWKNVLKAIVPVRCDPLPINLETLGFAGSLLAYHS